MIYNKKKGQGTVNPSGICLAFHDHAPALLPQSPRKQIYFLNKAKQEHLLIKYKTFFGHAPALLPLSPQKVLYLIKKSKKEKIQLKKEIKSWKTQ